MQKYILTLNDGGDLVVGTCGAASGHLWIDVYDVSLADCAMIFDNPDNTRHMEFHYGEMTDVFEGYTALTYLSREEDYVKVCMKKE